MLYPLEDNVVRHIFLPGKQRFQEGNDACPQATSVVGNAGLYKDDALVTQVSLPHWPLPT